MALVFISWYVQGIGARRTSARTPRDSPFRKNCIFSGLVIVYPVSRLVSSNVAMYSSISGNFILRFSSLFWARFSFCESMYCCSNEMMKVSHTTGWSSTAGSNVSIQSPIARVHPEVACPFMNVRTIATFVIGDENPGTCRLRHIYFFTSSMNSLAFVRSPSKFSDFVPITLTFGFGGAGGASCLPAGRFGAPPPPPAGGGPPPPPLPTGGGPPPPLLLAGGILLLPLGNPFLFLPP